MAINKIDAAVLFVTNRDECTIFYRDLLGLEETFSDTHSIGFRLGTQDLVILDLESAAQMISEEAISIRQEAGHRVLLCAGVEDVDATYTALAAKGVVFIKPPVSQSWGRRTAYFADPQGNLWEIWQPVGAEQPK